MPDDDAMPDAVAAWEAEHGRTWGDCGIPGCTDGHAHQPPEHTITPSTTSEATNAQFRRNEPGK